jgi:hypothetical protein
MDKVLCTDEQIDCLWSFAKTGGLTKMEVLYLLSLPVSWRPSLTCLHMEISPLWLQNSMHAYIHLAIHIIAFEIWPKDPRGALKSDTFDIFTIVFIRHKRTAACDFTFVHTRHSWSQDHDAHFDFQVPCKLHHELSNLYFSGFYSGRGWPATGKHVSFGGFWLPDFENNLVKLIEFLL